MLSGDKPLIFRPSQLYALVSVAGSLTFIFMSGPLGMGIQLAAIITIILMVAARMISIIYDVQTVPAADIINIKSRKNSSR